jgi:hypothetical protein
MQKPIELPMQPIVFKERDQRKQHHADEECIGHVSSDAVAFWPMGERPESFKRRTDRKADAKLGHSRGCKEQPQRNSVVMMLQAQLCQKRSNRTENGINAHCVRGLMWLPASGRPPHI